MPWAALFTLVGISSNSLLYLGAVDCTVEESLAAQYGIQGFPTVKIFSPVNKAPVDYQNARQAKPFCKAAFSVCLFFSR